MNEQPEVYTVKKRENDGLSLERRSFRSLGVAAGLILVGATGLILSGCSGSDDKDVSTTTGGTTTYSGSGTTAYSGSNTTTTTSYTDTKTLPCNSQPIPAGYVCTCNCV
jgi:hypothetical protein